MLVQNSEQFYQQGDYLLNSFSHFGKQISQAQPPSNLQNSQSVRLQFFRQLVAIVTVTVLSIMMVRGILKEIRVRQFIQDQMMYWQPIQDQDQNIQNSSRFVLPKKVWVYMFNSAQNSLFTVRLNLQNIRHYAAQSSFTVNLLNQTNYQKYLSYDRSNKLTQSLNSLRKRAQESTQQLLRQSLDDAIKTMIVLTVLHEQGGVVIDSSMVLTQNLSWLQQIQHNQYVNKGNSIGAPQIFCFHWLAGGSVMKRQQAKRASKLQKYMIRYPALIPGFIAAQPSTLFLQKVLYHIQNLYQKVQKYIIICQTLKLQLGSITKRQFIKRAFTAVSHLVIQNTQIQMEQSSAHSTNLSFAIDKFGIYSMNSRFFLEKIEFVFKTLPRFPSKSDNLYHYISKMGLKQLQSNLGPLRYAVDYDPYDKMNTRLMKAVRQDVYEVWQGSFAHKYLFLQKSLPFIKKHQLTPKQQKSIPLWNLPKILWIYWDRGIQNAEAMIQLCAQNMKRQAEAADFKVNYVSDANLHQYISNTTLQRIKYTIKSAKVQIRPQIKSDFYRLALVAQHGGVYLDATYYFIRNFSWITHIAEYPADEVYNRFGDVPRNLMLFHPIEGAPFNWTIDQVAGVKVAWHLGYQNNLIISGARDQLIQEWFEQLIYFVTHEYEETEQRMRQCGILDHKWTDATYRYLSAMDSIKCVLGRRQIDIDRNPSKYGAVRHTNEYYGLWAMNGFTGQQKFRYQYNLANSYQLHRQNHDNILMYRYDLNYTEGIIGKVSLVTKFYGEALRTYSRMLKRNYFMGVWQDECDRGSFFARYLFNSSLQQFYRVGGKVQVRRKSYD